MKAQEHNQVIFSQFIGVDVGKEKLAVYDSKNGKTLFIDNSRNAIRRGGRSQAGTLLAAMLALPQF